MSQFENWCDEMSVCRGHRFVMLRNAPNAACPCSQDTYESERHKHSLE